MAEPLVTSNDVEAQLLRPLTDAEATYLPTLITQAEAQLRIALRTVDDRIAAWATSPRPATALDPAAVAGMLAGVLKRYLTNPDGAASTTRSDGPFTQTTSYTSYGNVVAGGRPGQVEITDEDLARLRPRTKAGPGSMRVKAALAPGRLERDLRRGAR